jgi:hypothetical protein
MTLRHILFAVAAVALAPLSHAEGFDIKTGAWEVTSTSTTSGMLVPKDSLDKMPPAQRAKLEAMMAARAGKSSAHTSTTCITKQDLERGQLTKSDSANCTRKVIAQTARHYEMEETCTGEDASKTHAKFDAKSAESYTGLIDRVQGEGGKAHIEMSGRWLGAECKKGSGG